MCNSNNYLHQILPGKKSAVSREDGVGECCHTGIRIRGQLQDTLIAAIFCGRRDDSQKRDNEECLEERHTLHFSPKPKRSALQLQPSVVCCAQGFPDVCVRNSVPSVLTSNLCP